MIDRYKKLKIPMEEKTFIYPEVRQRLFQDMLQQYKIKCPGLTLIYAYLNFISDFPIDYFIIFSAKSDTGNKELIMFDIPYLYSDRTTPGYRYCKRENILNDFFEEATNQMPCLTRSRFNEYINIMLDMSLDKNNTDGRYWKAPENVIELGKGLVDLSTRYVKRNY